MIPAQQQMVRVNVPRDQRERPLGQSVGGGAAAGRECREQGAKSESNEKQGRPSVGTQWVGRERTRSSRQTDVPSPGKNTKSGRYHIIISSSHHQALYSTVVSK